VLYSEAESQKFDIRKGVRQGNPMSPIILNLLLGKMLRRFRVKVIVTLGALLKYLGFADDLTIIIKNEKDKQETIKWLNEVK